MYIACILGLKLYLNAFLRVTNVKIPRLSYTDSYEVTQSVNVGDTE
jgi:hypothetical protein